MRHLLATPRALLVLPTNGQGWRRRLWARAGRTAVALPRVCLLLLLVLAVPPAAAVEPDEMLADPALEARARSISQELRCLVCQNQSIDDSNAALAKDLRLIVRERLRAGDSNRAVLAFVEARYGEFVLLRPKLNANTLLLWLAPLLLLAATAVGVIRRTRASRTAPAKTAAQPLSTAEQQRLAELLQRERDPSA
jgi:cytochrome c-type biogenesis protein CcmH